MRKFAFTIMEILLAMSIIGIMAAATINSMGKMSANKVKVGFQNCYRHMVKTINSIVSDETMFPRVTNSSHVYDLDTGRNLIYPLCKAVSMNESTGVTTEDPYLFLREFMKATNVVDSSDISGGWKFIAKNGSYWSIKYQQCTTTSQYFQNHLDSNSADYIITFDVNGIDEGTNCPYNYKVNDNPSCSNCKNPDTFRFGLMSDNRLVPDENHCYNEENLKHYMKFAGFDWSSL